MIHKRHYITPDCEIYELEPSLLIAESSTVETSEEPVDKRGYTLEDPAPLRRLFPIFVSYDELEPDIKNNLQKSNYAVNYRYLDMMGMDYTFVVGTCKKDKEDLCVCFYVQLMNTRNSIIVYYNIYDILETFLKQIREKVDGEYKYHLSPEVRKKMPTFCKLLSNAKKNDKIPQFGLPMITFLDIEQKYPLLAAGFTVDEEIFEKQFEKIHDAFFRILEKISIEANDAGILNQSIKQMFKNGLRLLFMFRHLFMLP